MLPHAVAPPNKNKLLGFGCFKTPDIALNWMD